MAGITKLRLDEHLVANRHYASRARAREAVLRGCITLDGRSCTKPGRTVSNSCSISINDPAANLVSRAALKLIAALEKTGFDPTGKIAIDLGASTGGFCQVLLARKAHHVYAIDVGHGQMAKQLANHPHLSNLEGLNARDLSLVNLDGNAPQFITCDVSFISLKLALPAVLALAAKHAQGIFLIKPQFEVGKDGVGRDGMVRDATLARQTAEALCDWLSEVEGWRCTHFMESPITGGEGTHEFLMAGEKID